MTTAIKTVSTEVRVKTTRVFDEILTAFVEKKRRMLLEGGTYSSKTWSTMQALIQIAEKSPVPLVISVVSESLPHLKQGAMKDFFSILEEQKENNKYFNIQGSRYARPSWKGVFEFLGADSEGKALGPKRDILFMNEGGNIPWETARHLDTRTELFTIVDWNPSSEYWVYQYETSPGVVVPGWLRNGRDENAYCHSTYEDALDVISQQKVDDIEAYKDTDPNYWRIYGLGILGKITGLVYPNFKQVDELPEGDVFYGLDFGFSNDPSVLVKNVIIGDELYSHQLFYETGLTNDDIAKRLGSVGVRPNYDEIFSDVKPEAVEEIHRRGYNIKQTWKGKDSVEFGHSRVNQFKQYWTKSSIECIDEQRNFRFIQDKEGQFTDKTTHKFSHGMDARRYAVFSYLPHSKPKSKHSMHVLIRG